MAIRPSPAVYPAPSANNVTESSHPQAKKLPADQQRTREEHGKALVASGRSKQVRILADHEAASSVAVSAMHAPGVRVEYTANGGKNDSVAIAKFWDSLDSNGHKFLWGNMPREKWMKNESEAKWIFEADEVFLCKSEQGDIIGMTWYSVRTEDLEVPGGKIIDKEKIVEGGTVLHQDWRGCGLGFKLWNIRQDHLQDRTEITHVLAKVYRNNKTVIERLGRTPGREYIGYDKKSNMDMFLYTVDRPAQAPQTATSVATDEKQASDNEDRMEIDSDSDSELSEHSDSEFVEFLASAASTGKSEASLSAIAEQTGRRLRGQAPVSYAELASDDEDRMDIDADSDTKSEYSASEAARQGARNEASGSRSNVHVFNVDREKNISRIKDPHDLPIEQLALIVQYNKHPDQSWTEGCRSVAALMGLSLNYITSALNTNNKKGIGDDGAKKINDFRTEKQIEPGKYMEGEMRADNLDLDDDVFFWPSEVDRLLTRKEWLMEKGLIEDRRALRPTDESGLLKMKEEDYPRYQLQLLKIYNQEKDRPFSEMMGLGKSGVADVLDGRRDMGTGMVDKIHAFKKKKQDLHQLEPMKKSEFKGSTENIFFWPPEFDRLLTHAEWNLSRKKGVTMLQTRNRSPRHGIDTDQRWNETAAPMRLNCLREKAEKVAALESATGASAYQCEA